jgi:hypothetical protein
MKKSPLAVAGLFCLVLAGCRTDPSITLLERQNRMLEDEVYQLRGVIQDYEEGMTQNCVVTEGAQLAPDQGEMRRTRESTAAPSESNEPRSRKSSSGQAIQGPVVEMPGEALPPGKIPKILEHPAGTRTPAEPGKLNPPRTQMQLEGPPGPNLPGSQGYDSDGTGKTSKIRPTGGLESVAKDDSKDVGQLVLNRMLTGGYSTEGRSGDCGVLAVIEPRDAKGRRLEAPADVAVMLIDPSKTGPQAKLARWDFPAAETAKLFRGNGIARGMYVECPWPDRPPENNRLHLFVRYTTRDGRKLEADQSVEVALPGEKAARWTQAGPELQPAAGSDRELTANQHSDAEAAESEASDSPPDDSPPPRRARSMRTATRANSAAPQRPVWSPDRF